jgi:Lrp/AsnC family transcriptional regulator for asnA, asnC and gidA
MSRIDALDAEIITMLRGDGRRPNVDIARRLGVAEGTVRKRIGRMVRERVIQIGAWADPLKVGYQNYVNIELQVRLPALEAVSQRLAKLPEIFFLGVCAGRSNIFATACFRSNEDFHEFMTKRLSKVPGVERASTSNITRIVKREHSFSVGPPKESEDTAISARNGKVARRRVGR